MPRAAADAPRWAFLDLLRGVAALAVVMQHGLEHVVPGFRDWSCRVFSPGQFGVTLFLLISGFIIPASLERSGSNSRFWMQRVFRLFPLYWATIAFYAIHCWMIQDWQPPQTWQWLVNMTMLQEFCRVPAVSGVFWTLSLELLFYATCSLCHALGWLRRAERIAWLGQAGLFAAGVGIPLLLSRRVPGGFGFLFLTMFIGSLIYRFTTREVSGKHLGVQLLSLTAVALSVGYCCFAHLPRPGLAFSFQGVIANWSIAYLAFFAGLWGRALAMPQAATYLGRISYSLYLVHPCVILMLPGSWPPVAYLAALLTGTGAVASLTFRWIEEPSIQFGKRWLSPRPAVGGVETSTTRAA